MSKVDKVVENTSKIKKEVPFEDVRRWILKNFPGPEGTRLQICHLWDDYFRINYWLAKKSNNFMKEEKIVFSKFLKIDKECLK